MVFFLAFFFFSWIDYKKKRMVVISTLHIGNITIIFVKTVSLYTYIFI